MQLILFTKELKNPDADGLIQLAEQIGIEGYDLCIRDGYPVNPDNVETALPLLVRQLAQHGVAVPMVTGEGLWKSATHRSSEKILAAMAEAGVGLYKLGYMFYHPQKDGDYQAKVDDFRKQLSGWSALAQKHGVKVCYHTHCDVPGLELGYYLGTNCAALGHLIRDFDPRYVGAYIGTANLLVSGEPFAYGLEMIREYLSIVELQDMYYQREAMNDEGRHKRFWTPAGQGAVPWSQVFQALVRIGFDGPLTMHAEFEVPSGESFHEILKREAVYFKHKRDVRSNP